MTPTPSPTALRELANAMDDLERMRVYMTETLPKDGGMHARVEWNFGSGCTGYKELRGRVEKVVNAQLLMFCAEAIQAQETLVADLQKQVFGAVE